VIGHGVYTFYYRDVLLTGLDALASADAVDFGEGGARGAGLSRQRTGTVDADLFQQERHNVRRVHGAEALVMGVHLHADEALVSWSGAHNIYRVRARFVNIVGREGGWTTVGYIQHVPRAVGQSLARHLETSDTRSDLLQRCLAVCLRSRTCASETGVGARVAGRGDLFLAPRIVGLVVDQVKELAILGLMGTRCLFFCSPCMADKDEAPCADAVRSDERDVTQTQEAQLAAALVRRDDPRPARRWALGQSHSALAFVPALSAVHGLSTGSRFLYGVVSFDLLHVWKLGFLRLLAQRLPAFLTAICPGGGLRLGPTADALDVLNLRAFELGRYCNVCPTAPGYVRQRCGGWVRRALWLICVQCVVGVVHLLAASWRA